MNLDWLYNKAFVINLDRRADRMAETVAELRSCGITEYERYTAFDHPTSGHEGCSRSHRDLMSMLADAPWDRTFIMEDDIAQVTRARLKLAGFKEHQSVWQTHCSVLDGHGNISKRLEYMMPSIWPTYDVLYLGASYAEAPQGRVNRHLIRTNGMLTTGSMVVTREFAKKFTHKADEQTDGDPAKWIGPIDLFYSSMSRDNTFYCLQPRLFFQRKSRSDITGQEFSYLFSMTDPTFEDAI